MFLTHVSIGYGGEDGKVINYTRNEYLGTLLMLFH